LPVSTVVIRPPASWITLTETLAGTVRLKRDDDRHACGGKVGIEFERADDGHRVLAGWWQHSNAIPFHHNPPTTDAGHRDDAAGPVEDAEADRADDGFRACRGRPPHGSFVGSCSGGASTGRNPE
jgi:hypothetical protein